MHIEPGVVTGAKLALSYATAAAVGGYLVKSSFEAMREKGLQPEPEADRPTLIGCSALKRQYRDLLRESAGHDLVFIHLEGSRDVITERMAARTGHFMPVSLIDSQFAALEPLQADETGVAIDIDQPLEAVVVGTVNALKDRRAWD